ncbi:U-scoloptoxin(01)-Er1a-like [Paramacrobiotus metropolitanus]|uniref:U-scoloptoxin(01)-Er1a-like n=1 Tax=Paramacrobiotus metropolitanus TaxID=2943436 RepID=UPI002445FBF6|nr:U-scoloptoxin(01)-Er1a-like [Paramacrobiotus metropolitanus]
MNAIKLFLAFAFFVGHLALFVVGDKQYVFDLLKPALDVDQVMDILYNAKPGESFPIRKEIPKDITFDCSAKKNPGFYADTSPASRCQIFHRCDVNGNMTSYLCIPPTLFNQITLVCDYFFNVDCERFSSYVDFANSRLYTDQPLFDTPPNDWIPSNLRGSAALSITPKSSGNLVPRKKSPPTA